MGVAGHQMMEAERGHVVHRRFARSHHHAHHLRHEPGGVGKGHPDPVLGDVAGRGFRIPGQATEGVPVGLVEVRSGPVLVRADVGDARHPRQPGPLRALLQHPGHGRSRSAREGVRPQDLFVERAQIDEVGGAAEVFLGDLDLHHQRGPGHGAEQGVEGLARLEVDRAVLYLQHDVRAEAAVERLELVIGLLGPVLGGPARIDEGAPDHDAAVGGEGVGEHVGAVGMAAAIVLRPRLAFGVGLDQEAAEIRDQPVDLVGLRRPPSLDLGIQGIGGGETADLDRRAEFGREIDAHAIAPEHSGHGRRLTQIGLRKALGACVDVIDHRAVDPDRRIGPRVLVVAGVKLPRRDVPVPEGAPGIASLHRAIQVVPMVQQPEAQLGTGDDVQMLQRPSGLDQPEQVEGPVEDPDFGVGGDHDHLMAPDDRPADDIAFRPQRLQRQAEPLDQLRGGGSSHQDGPVAVERAAPDRRRADQALDAAQEFVPGEFQRRQTGAVDQDVEVALV